MDESFAGALVSEFKKLRLDLSPSQCEQFARYYELLCEWNERVNLTTVTGRDEVIRRHFADSLAPMELLPDGHEAFSGADVIDVGSGAGFPGIPLKIMNPAMHLTLLDSQMKRTRFLCEVADELSLSDAEAVHGRAEDLARDESYREKYDICVSRAVAGLATLAEYCLPFVKPGGRFIAFKSADTKRELEDAKKATELLGGRVEDVPVYETPDGGRSLIVIRKTENTPEKYPRKAGIPGKRPLK